MNPLPHESESRGENRSFFRTLKDNLFGGDDEEQTENYETRSPQSSSSASVRAQRNLNIHVSRASRVAVRLNLQVIEDAKIAIDGLRNGEHQIINLEKAKAEMRERILDFLMGACYALDGKVNRIGDKVYMFVPANVDVDTGDIEATAFRRSQYDDDSAL